MITAEFDGDVTRIGDSYYSGSDAPCPRCGNVIEFKHDRFGYFQFDVLTGIDGDHTCRREILCDDCQKDMRDAIENFLSWY